MISCINCKHCRVKGIKFKKLPDPISIVVCEKNMWDGSEFKVRNTYLWLGSHKGKSLKYNFVQRMSKSTMLQKQAQNCEFFKSME